MPHDGEGKKEDAVAARAVRRGPILLDLRLGFGPKKPMCGRFTLTASPERVAELLALAEIDPFPPRYNIAPTQPILIAIGGGTERPGANLPDRAALLVRWGLIPAWVKDPKEFPLLLNARAETAATKNAFRGAMKYRRCLIPASGFYEWKRYGKSARGARKSDAYFIKPSDGEPFAFAGLMESYLAADGSEIDTAAVLTTAANATIAAIHDRMPVVVRRRDHERWLDCRQNDPQAVADILDAANDDFFMPVRISDKVNKVANAGPEVQEPLDEVGEVGSASHKAAELGPTASGAGGRAGPPGVMGEANGRPMARCKGGARAADGDDGQPKLL